MFLNALLENIRGSIKSKTMWFNALLFALAYFADLDIIKDDPDLALLVAASTNLVLRVLTTTGLREK